MPLVFIIVLNYNGKADTLECLRSLTKITYANYRVLVIDNASMDNSVEAVGREFPAVQVLVNDENMGFAGGNNVGISYALEQGADYVFLLNNDTTVEPGVIDELIRVGESDAAIGIMGSLIYYYHRPGEVWFAGGKIYWPLGTVRHMKDVPAGCREVDFVTGCAFMVKRTVIEKTGCFDDDFFLYYEDADWGIRAKKAGFKLVVVPTSVVRHKEMGAVGGRSPIHEYYVARNNLLFMRKHANYLNWVLFIPAFILKIIIKGFLFAWRGNFYLVPAILQGIRDFVTGRLGKSRRISG